MKTVNKVIALNLVALLLYSLIIRFTQPTGEKSLGILLESALFIAMHVFIDLIAALAFYTGNNKEMAKSFLLSSGIILVVGFGTCLGNAAI